MSGQPAITVSIIVPTYQRPEALSRCLASIRATVEIAHEVICVSVKGDAATETVIRASGARHVVQPTRGGATQAMNMGFRAARGEFVMQVNDDCELLPWSVSNAVRFLNAPPHMDVGQVAFFHNSPVRRNIQAQIQLDGEWYVVCHVRGLCYANFGLMRRSLLERLGWLDERYFMYGADPDLSLKVWHEAQMKVEPCAGAIIRHAEMNDERGRDERSRQAEDNARLFAKWGLGSK